MAVAAGLLLTSFILVWISRLCWSRQSSTRDLLWLVLLCTWLERRRLRWIIPPLSYRRLCLSPWLWICLAIAFAFIFVQQKIVLANLRRKNSSKIQTKEKQCQDQDISLFTKPLVFPSRIHHVRMFPKKHSFAYSYLMVGIPVGWQGSVGTLLSAGSKPTPGSSKKVSPAWLSVDTADHLARGDERLGLREKLDSYLRSIVGWIPNHMHKVRLLTQPQGRKPRGISQRILNYSTDFSWLLLQSCLLLVPVYSW